MFSYKRRPTFDKKEIDLSILITRLVSILQEVNFNIRVLFDREFEAELYKEPIHNRLTFQKFQSMNVYTVFYGASVFKPESINFDSIMLNFS